MKHLGSNKNLLLFPKFKKCLVIVRFMRSVDIKGYDKCWEWKGACDDDGYGKFKWLEKGIYLAHQAAYVLFVGHRHGLCVLHTCDNPSCVNPFHLWLGTNKQNSEDMVRKHRQHDQRGEKNGTAKLNEYNVEKIRKLYITGKHSYVKLGLKFGVSPMTVWHVVKGNTWKESIQ
jgi:hypothetical protein